MNESSFGEPYAFPFLELLNQLMEILSTIMVVTYVLAFRKKPAKKGKGAKVASEKKEKKKPVTAAAKKVGLYALCMAPSVFRTSLPTDLRSVKTVLLHNRFLAEIPTRVVYMRVKNV